MSERIHLRELLAASVAQGERYRSTLVAVEDALTAAGDHPGVRAIVTAQLCEHQ